jgi:hypothetical protein
MLSYARMAALIACASASLLAHVPTAFEAC